MKKYKLMLTALLGAAFLFAPHESVNAAEPSDTISVSYVETAENSRSEWLSGYHYELLDDGVNEPVVKLKKCYLSGDVSVPGTAVVDGTAYRTLVTKECFSNCAGITSLRFLEIDGIMPLASEDMTEAFSQDPYLESIDISGLDLSKTQKISRMFSKNASLSRLSLSNDTLGTFYDEPCVTATWLFSESPSITALDLSGFDTTNVVNMAYIFSFMQGVKSFRFGGAFDTSNVTDLSYAFYDCPSYKGTLDLSAWNTGGSSTSKNKTMKSMFELFPAESIILTGFDTSNVTNMTYAFANTSFSRIDLSSFDTVKVSTMYGMFDGTWVDNDYLDWMVLGNGWNTSGVTDFSRMFNHRYITNACANEFAKATETTNASKLFEMFYDTKINCNSAHSTLSGAALDLTGWNVSSVTDFRNFLSSGIVACDLTGWDYSSRKYGDDAFGGAASKAIPAETAEAIEAKHYPRTVLDDPSKYNNYTYGKVCAGHTKDGREFINSPAQNESLKALDTSLSLYGTTSLPIRYKVNAELIYYIEDKEHTLLNPSGQLHTKITPDTYSISINKVDSPSTSEQEKWFCPYKAGLTTNGKEDRSYYEIYGYSDGRLAFVYAPTQSEWDDTVKRCIYTGDTGGFKAICNEGDCLICRISGFKEVDISEYIGNVQIQAPTVENGGLDLIGESKTDYSAEYEETDMPFSNVSYIIGRETANSIRPVEKKDFVFIGWFDTSGKKLTGNTTAFTPGGLSSEIIVPHYKVKEKDVSVSITFDAGEDAPDGLSLSFDPKSSECFSLSREGNKWSGTFSTTIGFKDRTFKLPALLIEGMDAEEPEYEFLGWEGEEGSFTVSSSDTAKNYKAVFKHNEKNAADPVTDDPTQDDPKQDDPTQDEPKQDDPAQDDPTQDDPKQDDPAQDDPTQDDPKQDDPAQDDPTQDEPKQDDPAQDDPKQDDPKQDDPTQDEPKQDEPKQNDPTQDEPKQDDPTQDDPAQDDPKQDDPKQDDPAQDDPKQDEPKQDDPTQDDPAQDDPKQDDPKQDDPKQDDPAQDDPKQDDPKQDDPAQDDPTQDEPKQDEPKQDDPTQDDPKQDEPAAELDERIRSLNDELKALREEKAQADAKNTELVDSLNKKIAELENTINTLSSNMSKNDEVPASTERGGNEGSGSNTGRSSSGNSSYGQGSNSSSGYSGASGYSTSNTSTRVSEAEKASVRVFETPQTSGLTLRSNDLSKMIAQPEPHYAYKASNGKVKLNYDSSVTAAAKESVEEYGFFSGDRKQDVAKTSSARSASEKAALSSDEMKKAAGNTAAHDGGLLEAQNIGRSIFGVMILVIVTGCAIFFTFRKKAVKKNRRSRK